MRRLRKLLKFAELFVGSCWFGGGNYSAVVML